MREKKQSPNHAEVKLSIIVPCFNEKGSILDILLRLREELPNAEIIVVDDASTDETQKQIQEVMESMKLKLCIQDRNMGKGAAVRAGLMLATQDWCVIQDADLEYNPADLKRMFKEVEQINQDVIYGSRYLRSGHVRGGAWINFFGVKLLAIWTWLLYGRYLSDPHTCYKMLSRKLFCSLSIQSAGFELCAEMNSKILARGIEIREIPISYQPRTVSAGKKIRLKDFFIAAWTYLRFRFFQGHVEQLAIASERDKSGNPSALQWLYLSSRIAIGLLLLLAGTAKLSPIQSVPITNQIIIPAQAIFAWGVFEFLFGWLCLMMIPHRLLNRFLSVVFTFFLALLSLQWWQGEESCHCMGSLSMPLIVMMLVDMVALLSLLIFRKKWAQQVKLPSSFIGEQILNLRTVFPVILLGGLSWFGSLDAMHGYLKGQNILVDSAMKFGGKVKQGEHVDVTYQLHNSTSDSIRVLGAKASCSCIAILDLPMTIEPGQDKTIRLRLRGRTAGKLQRESAELIFNDSALRVFLNATAIVHPNRVKAVGVFRSQSKEKN